MSKPENRDWPKGVIMDLDGTLIDSAPDIASALNAALLDAEIEPFALDEVRFMIGGGVPKLVERAFVARDLTTVNAPHDDRLRAVIAGVIRHYEASPVVDTVIYQGVVEVLEFLRGAGLKVGLCTNKPQSITEKALAALNMTTYFDAIVGGTDDVPRKPDPAPLQSCVDKLGLCVDDCLLVGDSTADRGAAAALDMTVFLVEYGYSKVPVATLRPDACLRSMSELLTLLFPTREIVRDVR